MPGAGCQQCTQTGTAWPTREMLGTRPLQGLSHGTQIIADRPSSLSGERSQEPHFPITFPPSPMRANWTGEVENLARRSGGWEHLGGCVLPGL
jgi:hypothetical protein